MELLKRLVGEAQPHPVLFVGIGYFDTMVITSEGAGISSTLRPQEKKHKKVKDAGKLTEKNVLELSEYVFSENWLEVSVGMAAINALLPHPEGYFTMNAKDLIISRGYGKNVGIIGHFPFVEEIKPVVKKLFVFERNPVGTDLSEEEIPEFLPSCDVVAITGMSIMNRSFSFIMRHAKAEAFKILLGPSTPLTPMLFDYGVDAVSGVFVKDPDTVKKYIMQGAPFRHIKGLEFVTMLKHHA